MAHRTRSTLRHYGQRKRARRVMGLALRHSYGKTGDHWGPASRDDSSEPDRARDEGA
ncbi:hypothetical protein [Prauserella cavernicola]|uniref:Uncharacterized protein n=1 Tax=Prauserella cavernicola TaxID=2800127 RepID=A0A934QZ68_9PSEU|nr:hypothetical protein [Prauserella cavernicola]MBK1789111.1 hypothetical protein [Prauserella cavernicola]